MFKPRRPITENQQLTFVYPQTNTELIWNKSEANQHKLSSTKMSSDSCRMVAQALYYLATNSCSVRHARMVPQLINSPSLRGKPKKKDVTPTNAPLLEEIRQ